MGITNVDFTKTLRGKCNTSGCDCDSYSVYESLDENNSTNCIMCGCYPGKHQSLGKEGQSSPVQNPQQKKGQTFPVQEMQPEAPSKQSDLQAAAKTQTVTPSTPSPSTSNQDNSTSMNESGSGLESSMEGHAAGTSQESDADGQTQGMPPQEIEDDNMGDPQDVNPVNVDMCPKSLKARSAESKLDRCLSISRPKLSFDLSEKIKKDGIIAHERELVRELCSDLLAELHKKGGDSKPTLTELDSYARQITDFYPVLRNDLGKNKWAALRTAMSRRLINQRYVNAKSDGRNSPKTLTSCVPLNTSADDPTEMSLEEAIRLLKEVTRQTSMETAKKLITLTARERKRLLTEDPGIPSKMAQEWPHILIADLLIFDFLQGVELTFNTFSDRVRVFLGKAANVVKTDEEAEMETDDNIDEDEESGKNDEDVEALTCLSKLAALVAGNKYKRSTKIISIIEPNDSLEVAKPLSTESPRILFLVADGKVTQCLVLFDATKFEVPNPTVSRAMAALLGCYYVMDIAYPAPYHAFLKIVDKELLGKPVPTRVSQAGISMFYRALKK